MDNDFYKCDEFDTYIGKYYKLENLYPNIDTPAEIPSTHNDYIKVLGIDKNDNGCKYLKCLKFKKLGESHIAIDLDHHFSFYLGDYVKCSEIPKTEFYTEWTKMLKECKKWI